MLRQPTVRSLIAATLSLIAAAVLTGCLSMDLTTTVSPDARFTGIELAEKSSGDRALVLTSAITAAPIEAPAAPGQPGGIGGSDNSRLPLLLGGAIVLLVLAAIGILIGRRRSGPAGAPSEPDEPGSPPPAA